MSEKLLLKHTKSVVWRIVLATITAFVASALYYVVFGQVWLRLRGLDPATATTPHPVEAILQFVRNLVVATVLVTLLRGLKVTTRGEAVRWGLTIWLGFQAMQILGSVLHEDYPFGLYVLHVGDALMTTLILTLILGPRLSAPKAAPPLDAMQPHGV